MDVHFRGLLTRQHSRMKYSDGDDVRNEMQFDTENYVQYMYSTGKLLHTRHEAPTWTEKIH